MHIQNGFIHRKLRVVSGFAIALIIACASACHGQDKGAASPAQPAAASYSTEAFVVEKAETVYRYEADGTGEKEVHVRLQLQSEAGVRQYGVLSMAYASATENPQIESVVAQHSDGTTTETPASDAMAMPAPVTQQAPLYSDLKQLQVPVRGLRVGDVLEYRVRIQRKDPEAPAQFWDSYKFQEKEITLSETVTLDVPIGKYVQVWSPDHKPTITDKDGRRIYVWTGNQLKPTSSEPKEEASAPPKEIKPDVAWTTFHSWAEVGEWYRTLAAPRAVLTDALRAQADEITRDAKSPLDQVQALYSFVSTHIRYVGIDFGVGRYQPHLAAEVQANQYGDCKDKDTLLEALLHAKEFTTAPALVGVSLAVVPELPSPAFFNHVITTVSMPDGRIWMDSTPGVAAFQFLLPLVRDKQALVIPPTGSADLEHTPAKGPFPFVNSFEATATLDTSGNLSGKVTISYRSDDETSLRLIGQNLAPAQWDQGTQVIARALGFSGTTSNSSFGRVEDTTQPMQVNYDYAKKPFGDWDNLRILPLFPSALGLPMAPDKQPESEIDLGALRTDCAVSRIQLPAGYSAELPDAVHVKTRFATWDLTYKFADGELTAERKLAVLQSRVAAADWEKYKKFTKDVSLGELDWIQLQAPARAGNSAAGFPPSTGNANAANLIAEVVALEQKNDLIDALAKLDEAKKLNPEQPFLWSNYGFIAMRQNRINDAKEDFRHELAKHPDENFVIKLYAGMLMAHGEVDEAAAVLKVYFDRDATDQQVDVMLADAQSIKSIPGAIATLRTASDALPDHPLLQTALAKFLIRNHQEADAGTLMEKLLGGQIDDPLVLNDAAYELAEANMDLPLAEEKSRKSLEILAGRTADEEVSEVNATSFQRSAQSVAGWDTLGSILLKENKLDEAHDYLEAAWHNQPLREMALHYGELLEAAGDRKEAMRVYTMSIPQLFKTADPSAVSIYEQIDAHRKKLENDGVSSPKVDAINALKQEITFKLKLAATDSNWSATYRLQLDASGIAAAMVVSSGVSPRQGVVQAIRQLSLPHLVPHAFKGRIIRDATVSCSAGKAECEFVLLPMGTIAAEHPTQ